MRDAQTIEVELAHVVRAHALRGERAKSAVEASVNLLLHERFRHHELEALDESIHQRVFGGALKLAAFFRSGLFAQSRLEGVDGLEISQLLGELVVEFGEHLALDGLDFNLVNDSLARETLFVEVLRVGNLELEFLARLCSAQRFVECGEGIGAANLDEYAVALDRIADRCNFGCFVFGPFIGGRFIGGLGVFAAKVDLCLITIGQGALLGDWFHRGAGIEDAR